MTTYEVVCGDTGREIRIPLTNADGIPIPITGAEDVAMQGTSLDLPGVAFNHLGMLDALTGEAILSQLGTLVTAEALDEKPRATFLCRVQCDGPGGIIHTPEFTLRFVRLADGLVGPEGALAMPYPLMMRHDVRSFAHEVNTIGSGLAGIPRGIRRGTWTEKCRGVARDVSSDTITTNKVFEVVEDFLIGPERGGSQPHWSKPWAYSMIQNSSVAPGSPAGECLQGIEMGSFSTQTPWQTNYATVPIPMAVTQLRFNYTRGKWEVLVWDGDTALAPDVVDCDWQPAVPSWVCDVDIKELRMDYLPGPAGVGSRLECRLNGQLVKTYTGQRLDNCYGQNGGGSGVEVRAGYFVTGGSNAPTRITETTFYSSRIWQAHEYPDPPNA